MARSTQIGSPDVQGEEIGSVRHETRLAYGTLLVLAMVVTSACEKAQLLAPTSSTITVSAQTLLLASGGSTQITAFVLEQSGTPVQNGTTVRFSTTLGRVDPVETQTRNGLAFTMFFAENSSGVAEVRATSVRPPAAAAKQRRTS